MAALTAFFEARRGQLYGFRFRDFADFKSCAPGATVSAADQALGLGDGVRTVFALSKRHGDDEAAAERRIAKPVAGTVQVAVGGVEQANGAFTVDQLTSLFMLGEAPQTGAVVTAASSSTRPCGSTPTGSR